MLGIRLLWRLLVLCWISRLLGIHLRLRLWLRYICSLVRWGSIYRLSHYRGSRNHGCSNYGGPRVDDRGGGECSRHHPSSKAKPETKPTSSSVVVVVVSMVVPVMVPAVVSVYHSWG